MKNHGIKITALLLAMSLILSACGEKGDEAETSANTGKTSKTSVSQEVSTSTKPVDEEEDDLLIAKSADNFDFCTKYLEDYSYKWDDECGITIYTQSEGYIPYVLVWRSFDTDSTAAELHEAEASDMFFVYGNDLLSVSEQKEYKIGGKTLIGVEYTYQVDGNKIELLRLIDDSPKSGYVLYTAKYQESSKAKTIEALETAINYYKAGKDSYEKVSNNNDTEGFEIVPSISKTIQYEQYADGWVSFDYPKGWAVRADSCDGSASGLQVHVYDPKKPDRQFYITLHTLWFESEAAHKKLSSYPLAGAKLSIFPYLLGAENPVQEMFQNFNVLINSIYGNYMDFTSMNNWTEIENLGQTPLGGDIIRGSYTNDAGEEIEGIFSGLWKKGLTIYGYKYPGCIYSPMFMTAPSGEFGEWEEILSHCISSFVYTEEYINDYMAEQESTMSSYRANTKIYNDMSDMITSSWNERQTTYDTISAKQSDATLGYDRVYNTETGEVYRVSLDFMDSYSGSLYKKIDDSMYSLPVAGYIY